MIEHKANRGEYTWAWKLFRDLSQTDEIEKLEGEIRPWLIWRHVGRVKDRVYNIVYSEAQSIMGGEMADQYFNWSIERAADSFGEMLIDKHCKPPTARFLRRTNATAYFFFHAFTRGHHGEWQ